MLETLHSSGDLPRTGAEGCGISANSTGFSSCISKKVSGPTLNIGASFDCCGRHAEDLDDLPSRHATLDGSEHFILRSFGHAFMSRALHEAHYLRNPLASFSPAAGLQ